MERAERYDVAVVGAGPAGVAAALAAARMGARTLLLERETTVGGNVGQALVHTLCGLYHAARDGSDDPELAQTGLPGRLASALREAGLAAEPERAGRVWYLPIESAGLVELFSRWCASASHLDVACSARLTAAEVAGGCVSLRYGDGACATARLAIDASGDAALVSAVGGAVDAEGGETLQHPAYLFRLSGVEGVALEGFARVHITADVARSVRRGVLPAGCESLVIRPAPGTGAAYCTLNLAKPPQGYDPLDARQVDELGVAARAAAEAIVSHLVSTRPGFERVRVDRWPARVGLRETRRGRGVVSLSRDHVLGGQRGDRDVALSTWPIELWHDHRRASYAYPRAACGIPLEALRAQQAPRIGLAGRCLSASHDALGALRVIGTAMATGEAIGTAAALAADAAGTFEAVAPADVVRTVRDAEGALP